MSFEIITLRAGNDYWLTNIVDDSIRVRINGASLGIDDTLKIDGWPRSNGFSATGGAGRAA